MKCPTCGTQNREDSKFCYACGASLTPSVTTPQSDATAPIVTPATSSSTVETNQTPHTGQAILPASMLQRFTHNILDHIIAMLIVSVLSFPLMAFFGTGFGTLFFYVGYFFYFFIFEKVWGQTVAKMITGTKVVSTDGGTPSTGALVGRTFARFIPFEPLSFLFYGKYPTKGWHDRLSSTLVVPKHLTPEQIRAIDPEKIRAEKHSVLGSFLVMCAITLLPLILILSLTAVVISSLSVARDKGADAALRANLFSLSSQAYLYQDSTMTFEGFCMSPDAQEIISSAFARGGEYDCNDSLDAFAIGSYSSEGDYVCIDSTNTSVVTTTGPLNARTSCSL